MRRKRREYLDGVAVAGALGLAGCRGGGGTTEGGQTTESGTGDQETTQSDQGGEPAQWTYGTSAEGSSSFEIGQVMSQVFSNQSDSLNLDPITTPGYFANIRLLSQGEIDVGMTWMRDGASAYQEQGPFADDPVETPPIQAGPVHLINAQTYYTYPDNDISSIDDLAGKVVTPGPAGAGATIIVESLLEESDVYDEIDIRYMSYSDIRNAVRNNNIDAWAAVNLNYSAWTSAHSEIFQLVDAELVDIPDSIFEAVSNSSSFLFTTTINKEDWEEPTSNLPDQFPTISSTASSAIVPPDADADLVYEFVRGFSENIDQLREQIGFFKPVGYGNDEFGLEGLPDTVPFHEGAVRYYKEEGIWSEYDLTAQGE
jgi:TRAP transporter TAXI family solute receptor